MKLTTVLFDLDGTLLPMDMDAFIKLYFANMAAKLMPLGYPKDGLIKAIWGGTEAMIRNDGTRPNEEVFWNCFVAVFGSKALEDKPVIDEFYTREFIQTRAACGYTELAKAAVDKCKALGLRVALATNPVFPAMATRNRIGWAGLSPEDFELVTTYENSSSCKPNLIYYREVLGKLGVDPRECLMVGNDVGEDMIAEKLGMRVFLLKDNLINKDGRDISSYPQGRFPELISFILEAL